MSPRLAISFAALTTFVVAAGGWSGGARAAAEAPPAVAPPAVSPAPAGGAEAVDPFDAANAALAEGNRLFNNDDFEGALAAYRRAQALYPKSATQIDFNVGKAEDARGRVESAAQAWERFLSGPLGSAAVHREEVTAKLRNLGEQLGTLRLETPKSGLRLLVDGIGHGTTPFELRVWLRPGQHRISLEDSRRVVFTQEIDVQPGASVRLTLSGDQLAGPPDLKPRPEPGGAGGAGGTDLSGGIPPERPAIWKRWWFWAAGAAIVGGTVAAVLLVSHCPSGSNVCKEVSVPPQ